MNYAEYDEAMRAEVTRLRAELAEAHGCLSDLLDAMHRYEMDVDCGPTSEHRQMMARARQALARHQQEVKSDA